MNSVLEDDSYMETMSMLGAGSVLKSGSRMKSKELWVGNPAKKVRDLTGVEVVTIEKSAVHYRILARQHLLETPTNFDTVNPITTSSLNI